VHFLRKVASEAKKENSIDATHLRCTSLNIIVSKRAGLAIFLSVINFDEIKRGVVSYDKSRRILHR